MSIEQHPFTSNRWLKNNNNYKLNKYWYIDRDEMNQVSSFGFMPNKETQSIFLGSFPIWEITIGQVSDRNVEFFYGSIQNHFWPLLGSIFEKPVDNIENRIAIVETYNFGITDILETVDRNPPLSNSDNCLTSINYNNILNLKKTYPCLKNIFITSGGKAPIRNLNNGFIKPIIIDNIEFNLISLLSPSPQTNVPISGILNRNNNFGIDYLSILDYKMLQWAFFLKKYHFKEYKVDKLDSLYETVINNDTLLNNFLE